MYVVGNKALDECDRRCTTVKFVIYKIYKDADGKYMMKDDKHKSEYHFNQTQHLQEFFPE
jgi:hypothetical protein